MLFDPLPSMSSRRRASGDWMAVWQPAWHCVLLFVLGALWGLQFVLLKIATNAGLGEFNILLTSMVLIAAGFLGATAMTKAWFRPSWSHVRFFFTSGLLGFVLPFGAAILAAREISAGVIVLFEALTPVAAMALALVLKIEAVTRRGLLSMIFAVLCVLCFLVPSAFSSGGISLAALGFVLVVPIACACDCIYVAARWPNDLRPMQIVTGEAVGAAALLIPCFFFYSEGGMTSLSLTYSNWAVLIFVAVSFIEVYLYFHLISRAGAIFVSFASLISLFAGIFFGIILIGESHPASVWLAVGFAVIALYAKLYDKQERDQHGSEQTSLQAHKSVSLER